MYRQILIRPEDRHFQHILAKHPISQETTEFELNTVIYGLTPSSYQAQRVLKQLVEEDGKLFQLASQSIRKNTYMDHIVSGADSIKQTIQLRHEFIQLLNRGYFELRK